MTSNQIANLANTRFKPPALSKVKKSTPFSLRLSPEERAYLKAKAGRASLSAYIKSVALADAPTTKRRSGASVVDKKAMAQALALLGQSRVASNLNQLSRLANMGALPLTPDVEKDLTTACQHIFEIKALLIHAIGLKDRRSN